MIYAPVKLITIGSDDGLSPGRRQAIIWTNAGTLLMSKILGEIHTLSFKEMYLKTLSRNGGLFVWASLCETSLCNFTKAGVFTSTGLSSLSPPETVIVTASGWARGDLLAGALTPRSENYCNECPNCLLSTCSSVHVSLSLFYVLDRHDMWLCIHNEWDICLDPSGQ